MSWSFQKKLRLASKMCQLDEKIKMVNWHTYSSKRKLGHEFSLCPPHPQITRLKDSGVRTEDILKSWGNQCEEEEGRKEAQSPNHNSQIPERFKGQKFQDCKTAIMTYKSGLHRTHCWGKSEITETNSKWLTTEPYCHRSDFNYLLVLSLLRDDYRKTQDDRRYSTD